MGLVVVGAGLGRTGTKSLKSALEYLGFGPCYHMVEVLENPHFIRYWNAAASGEAMDWDAVFDGYRAAVDWPVASYWRELADYYPESKIILSVRSAESWYDSAMNTIFSAANQARVGRMMGDAGSDAMRPMMRKILVDTFGGKPLEDKDNALEAFRRHNQAVIDHIAPERLLVFEAEQGWEPLCRFLDVAVPDIPYVQENTREQFADRMNEQLRDST